MAVENYLFKYADGTTGNSPYRRDASGQIILNAAGGIADEGSFMGRSMADGTVNQSPIGNVTPQGNVNLYGGYSTTADNYYSTPVAGPRPEPGYGTAPAPAFGGAATPGAVFGPSGAGAAAPASPASPAGGAAWGGSATTGGGLLGSAMGGSSSSYGNSVSRDVVPGQETIEGRLGNLLGMDASGNYTNGVIRQASENAMAQFAGRGLLNSSMATEAATQAAMSKAIEIAGPDAQTYFSQGRANQDAANVFKRDDKGYAQENIVLDKNQALDREKMAQAGSQFNQELAFKYEALKLDKNSQNEATSLAHKYALEMNNIKAVDSSFDLYLRRISEIDNNKDLTADTKAQMKNSAGKDFDLYAKAKGIVYEQQFGGRYETKEKPGAAPPSEPPVSGGLGGDGGILGSAKR